MNLKIQTTANPNQTLISHGKEGFDPRNKTVYNPKTGLYNIPVTNKMKATRPLVDEAKDIIKYTSEKLRR